MTEGPEMRKAADRSGGVMNLSRLIYKSIAIAEVVSNETLRDLEEKSAAANTAQVISGLLILSGNVFLQVLEGKAPDIAELFGRIAADKRHRQVELVTLMQEYNVDKLEDEDPRTAELMAKLCDRAPVRKDLDCAEIELPGFVVPVEGDAEETTSFLLVSYYGACIHVPLPALDGLIPQRLDLADDPAYRRLDQGLTLGGSGQSCIAPDAGW